MELLIWVDSKSAVDDSYMLLKLHLTRLPTLSYTQYSFLIKILVVCLSVCDGCGHGRNGFAGHHHVRYIFHRNGHIKYSKSCCWSGNSGLDAIVSACHRTSDRQEHEIIWPAGPERDMIFHLHVTACREHARQPLSRQAII